MGIFLFPLLKFGPFLFILFIFFSLSLCLAGLGGSVTLTRAWMGIIYYAEINVVCIIDCFHGLLFSSFFEVWTVFFSLSFSLSLSWGGLVYEFMYFKFSVGFGNGSWKLVWEPLVPSFGYLEFVLALWQFLSIINWSCSISFFLLLLAFSFFFFASHTNLDKFSSSFSFSRVSWILVDECHKFMLGVVRLHLLVWFLWNFPPRLITVSCCTG